MGLVTNSIAESAPEFPFKIKGFVKKCRYGKNEFAFIATHILLLKYLTKASKERVSSLIRSTKLAQTFILTKLLLENSF